MPGFPLSAYFKVNLMLNRSPTWTLASTSAKFVAKDSGHRSNPSGPGRSSDSSLPRAGIGHKASPLPYNSKAAEDRGEGLVFAERPGNGNARQLGPVTFSSR